MRTLPRWVRVYLDGYDVSHFLSGVGPLVWEYETAPISAWNDNVVGAVLDRAIVTPTRLEGIFDPGASGLHAIMAAAGSSFVLSVAVGTAAAPALGDPVFCGVFENTSYKADPSPGMLAAPADFGGADPAELTGYESPWGSLLLPKTFVDADPYLGGSIDNLAATQAGGFAVVHVFGGTGQSTITVEHSTNGSSWATLLTTGQVDPDPAPYVLALDPTDEVRRRLRVARFGGGGPTEVTMAVSFVRGR